MDKKRFKLGKKYLTRGGYTVQHIKSGSVWSAPVLVLKCEDSSYVGADLCFLLCGSEDPLHWLGGAHGAAWDIVKVITPSKKNKRKG